MAITPLSSNFSALPVVRPEDLGAGVQAPASNPSAQPSSGFGSMLDGLVNSVQATQANADDLSRQVLLGQSGQLHQSVIAMQEASVSLSLMVQVRNKLVDSYQELMRMQV